MITEDKNCLWDRNVTRVKWMALELRNKTEKASEIWFLRNFECARQLPKWYTSYIPINWLDTHYKFFIWELIIWRDSSINVLACNKKTHGSTPSIIYKQSLIIATSPKSTILVGHIKWGVSYARKFNQPQTSSKQSLITTRANWHHFSV